MENTHSLVTEEKWEHFTRENHETWKVLFERQSALLKNRAAEEVLDGMNQLGICNTQIPKFSELNAILKENTGFSVVAVKGLIPEDLFFKFLSERQFPSTCFIREPSQLDYLVEPDIFHDVFGHIPLLVHPIFADFMQEFGVKGLESIEAGLLDFAARLYWFTVEFGLIKTPRGLRIYGAGITSSKTESIYCLESEVPKRIKFNPWRILKTQYHIDSFQRTYFVIENYQEIFNAFRKLDWEEVKDSCLHFPDIDLGIVINGEEAV